MYYYSFFSATYSVPELPPDNGTEAHYSVPRGGEKEKVIALYDYEAQGEQVHVHAHLYNSTIIHVHGRHLTTCTVRTVTC